MAHICVSKLTIIGSDNGLSPGRRQAITWTNVGILLIGPQGTNFIVIWIEIQILLFKKMHLKMSSAKWGPFWLGLNVLNDCWSVMLALQRRIFYWCVLRLSFEYIPRVFNFVLFTLHKKINQSIKSSFVKGAGAHPKNAPCRRRSHALRSAPVKRGRLLSAVLHRWSPRHSIMSDGLR